MLGASSYSPGFNPPRGPPTHVPCPAHLVPPFPLGLRMGPTGRGSWKEALEEGAEKTDKPRKKAGERTGEEQGAERGGKLRGERRFPDAAQAFPAPASGSLQAEGAQFLEALISQKPLLQGPTERRESAD